MTFVGSAWDMTMPGRFYDAVKSTFPRKRELGVAHAQFTFSAEGQAAAGLHLGPPRMQFLDQEERRVIQLARDLLIVNRLRPYSHFQDWEEDIHQAAEIYRDLATPHAVRSISLRYLNRVEVPEPVPPLSDLLTLHLHLWERPLETRASSPSGATGFRWGIRRRWPWIRR